MSRSTRPTIGFVERRAAERKATALLAFALHPDGSKFPCQVKNISDRGAMLEFVGSHVVMLGTAFELVLVNSEVRYSVKLIWRKERTAGVLFCLGAEP